RSHGDHAPAQHHAEARGEQHRSGGDVCHEERLDQPEQVPLQPELIAVRPIGMGARLIAEIGGSSSRWAFIPVSGDPLIFPRAGEVLPGYNPLSGDAGIFSNGVKEYFDRNCAQVFEAVELNVYGAGCGTAERQDLMSGALRTLWPEAKIAVDSDLMAAALGLCDGSPALVVILGTGMNAGHFDGRVLHRPMPSLGYILGDEGSGADIGKTLLQDAFYRRMPPDV